MFIHMQLARQIKLRLDPLVALDICRARTIENNHLTETLNSVKANIKADRAFIRVKISSLKILAILPLLFSSATQAGLDQSRFKVSATVIDTNQQCETVDQYQMCWPSGGTCLAGNYTVIYLMLGDGKLSQPLRLNGENRVKYCAKS